jgi:hypothetical protein
MCTGGGGRFRWAKTRFEEGVEVPGTSGEAKPTKFNDPGVGGEPGSPDAERRATKSDPGGFVETGQDHSHMSTFVVSMFP